MESEKAQAAVYSKVARAEEKIDSLCEKLGITEDGAIWVKQTLDPFNDQERKKVGYPDVIVGKSVIQKVPIAFSYTNSSGASQDVHVFLDSCDCAVSVYENTIDTTGTQGLGNTIGDAALGIGTQRRGGLCLRFGPAGTDLTQATGLNTGGALGPAALDVAYLAGSGARVISKGFEIVNSTNKLSVGGAVRCYRATGAVPYDNTEVHNIRNSVTPLTTFQAREARTLQTVPKNVAEVELYTDHTFWEAEKGCMVVAIPSAQTNEPKIDSGTICIGENSVTTPSKRWINVTSNGANYPSVIPGAGMFSPFYLCGAYFTGLPDKTTLDIRAFYYVERFVDSSMKDLVILANPSPGYDPLALQMMTNAALKLPCGTPVRNNAMGDWIKTVADVASVFGVPGMPFVRGAVDLAQGAYKAYQNFSKDSGPNEGVRNAVKNVKTQSKLANKNQKRKAKGKAAIDEVRFIQKKQQKKAGKKAYVESRAGMASGGSK